MGKRYQRSGINAVVKERCEVIMFVYCSVVCVGGDGMFSEVLHGLIGRTQQEAGLCETDPAVTLQPCPLHIGIIPAGCCS